MLAPQIRTCAHDVQWHRSGCNICIAELGCQGHVMALEAFHYFHALLYRDSHGYGASNACGPQTQEERKIGCI